jgi:hypothetical protein
VAAVDVRIDRRPLAASEASDLAADLIDLANPLVPRCQRIDPDVGPVMQVEIGAAHAGLMDLDPRPAAQRVALARRSRRNRRVLRSGLPS